MTSRAATVRVSGRIVEGNAASVSASTRDVNRSWASTTPMSITIISGMASRKRIPPSYRRARTSPHPGVSLIRQFGDYLIWRLPDHSP